MHNPRAKVPVPKDFFRGLVQYHDATDIEISGHGFHIYESQTFIFCGPSLSSTSVRSRLMSKEDGAHVMLELLKVSSGLASFAEVRDEVF